LGNFDRGERARSDVGEERLERMLGLDERDAGIEAAKDLDPTGVINKGGSGGGYGGVEIGRVPNFEAEEI
jgi:hypothetical protein